MKNPNSGAPNIKTNPNTNTSYRPNSRTKPKTRPKTKPKTKPKSNSSEPNSLKTNTVIYYCALSCIPDDVPSKKRITIEKEEIPTLPLSTVYNREIPMDLLKYYRSAGILVHSKTATQKRVVLLGSERRSDGVEVWSEFKGKREPHEFFPQQTAIREFHEETNNFFSGLPINWEDELKKSSLVVWNEAGKYLMFFCELPYTEKLPSFRHLSQKEGHLNKIELQWFDVPEFIEQFSKEKSTYSSGDQPFLLDRFFWSVMKQPGVAQKFLSIL